MANQIFTANVNSINEVALSTPQAFRIGCNRVVDRQADPDDNTKSIIDLQIKEGVVFRLGLNLSLADLATAMGADQVDKMVNVNVVKLDGIALPATRAIGTQAMAFIYATANPADGTQSIMLVQSALAATTEKWIVAHTLAQLSTLYN